MKILEIIIILKLSSLFEINFKDLDHLRDFWVYFCVFFYQKRIQVARNII
jgi:hypothetical protein